MHSLDVAWIEKGGVLSPIPAKEVLRTPLRVGVLFSGGPASGGNDVIAGLYHTLKEIHPDSELIGILGGPIGLLEKRTKKIREEEVAKRIRRGGFDFLGTGRTKIEKEEDFRKALESCNDLDLDGLIFIGGDDTNTNAYHLAEYFENNGSKCSIVGIPKTIDGDLKGKQIEASFGFDTATKVYSELIGNICTDAASSLKYTHFIRLMGRSASHIALECALMTQPNLTFISEEVSYEKKGVKDLVEEIVTVVKERAQEGKHYGVILLPEGLIEAIFETKRLIQELNRLLAKGKTANDLDEENFTLFESLPKNFQQMLLLERDPHGNVQLSLIEIEKLLSEMVKEKLSGTTPFHPLCHFFGYEGRCATPSLFDATYCYQLGIVAALLVRDKKTGCMASIKNLGKPVQDWEMQGVPLSLLMGKEERKGEMRRVIKKTLVDLQGPVFKKFKEGRKKWRLSDSYLSPGPMQLSKFLITKTLEIEK